MKKFAYEILINGGCKRNERIYSFGSTKSIKLFVGKDKATIKMQLTEKKSSDDFVSFSVKSFRDAYRKVYLIHAINYHGQIEVKELVIITPDGETVYTDKYQNFPFLFSMLGNHLELAESWKNIIDPLLLSTKTSQNNDFRFSAAFSYLAGISREKEIDKFSNLWTAMNAYYSYLHFCYMKYLKDTYGCKDDDLKALKLDTDKAKYLALICHLDNRFLPDMSNDKELWKNNYRTENELLKIGKEKYHLLYSAALEQLNGKCLPNEFLSLQETAETFHMSLFPFLLVRYPYQCRCKYLHGEKSMPIIAAYNDYEVTSLGAANYFLARFLNTAIPEMFENDFWNEKKQWRTEQFGIEYSRINKHKKYNEIINKVRAVKENDND